MVRKSFLEGSRRARLEGTEVVVGFAHDYPGHSISKDTIQGKPERMVKVPKVPSAVAHGGQLEVKRLPW